MGTQEIIDLSDSGLPIFYDTVNSKLKGDVFIPRVNVRKFNDMSSLYYERPKFVKDLYYMYRGVYLKEHKKLFLDHKLRYDITIMPPLLMGREYIKTKGHKHNCYEVYEVLYGKAIFMTTDGDVVLYNVNKGERVIISSNTNHVMINPGKDFLVVANLMPFKVKSNYKEVFDRKGMPFYVLYGKRLVRNKYYEKKNLINDVGLRESLPLYVDFIKDPVKFEFLKV